MEASLAVTTLETGFFLLRIQSMKSIKHSVVGSVCLWPGSSKTNSTLSNQEIKKLAEYLLVVGFEEFVQIGGRLVGHSRVRH